MAADCDICQGRLACVKQTTTPSITTIATIATVAAASTDKWGTKKASPTALTAATAIATTPADRLIVADGGVSHRDDATVVDRTTTGIFTAAGTATRSPCSWITPVVVAIATRSAIHPINAQSLIIFNFTITDA